MRANFFARFLPVERLRMNAVESSMMRWWHTGLMESAVVTAKIESHDLGSIWTVTARLLDGSLKELGEGREISPRRAMDAASWCGVDAGVRWRNGEWLRGSQSF